MGYPYPPQQPQWQQPGGYPPPGYPTKAGNPALAVIAAILGVAAAGLLAWQTFDLLAQIPDGVELPGEFVTLFVVHFVAAGIALLGAILVFSRLLAGAFLLLCGGILVVAAVMIDPLIVEGIAGSLMTTGPPGMSTGSYYELLFEFKNAQATLRTLAAIAGVGVAVLAALPPSLRWLRKQPTTGYPPPVW